MKRILITYIFISLLTGLNFTLFAQQTRIERLEDLLEMAQNDLSKVEVLNALFEEYYKIDKEKAEQYGKEAFQIAESIDSKKNIAIGADNLAKLYQNRGQYEKATLYYERALEVRGKLKDRKGEAKSLNDLGNLSLKKGDENKALNYYLDALSIRREIKDYEGESVTLTNLGSFYYRLENYTKALVYYNQALILTDNTGNKKVRAYVLNKIAECHFWQENYEEALNYFQQQLYVAQATNNDAETQRAYQGLSQVYARIGNYKKAYEAYRNFVQVKEVVYKKSQEISAQKIDEIEAENQSKQRELFLERQIKQDEIDQRRLTQNFSIAAFSLILVIMFILYRSNRINKRNADALKQQKQEIEKKNEEVGIALEEIEKKNETLEGVFADMDRKNKDITASINYAKRIQESMLPFETEIQKHIPEYFIFFRPRDIVSGDFYWFSQVNNKVIIAAIDCTGHGVPGAIMSMVGNDHLNQIINIQELTEPHLILSEMHKGIRRALRQDEGKNRDGMDVALCVIDYEEKTLEFAGASRPLIYIKNGELNDWQTSKLPIAGFQKDPERNYEKLTLSFADAPLSCYMFSDGYQDQFGGPKGRKFAKKKLKNLLFDIHELPIEEQKYQLDSTLKSWMGENRQMDDILVVGFRLQ